MAPVLLQVADFLKDTDCMHSVVEAFQSLIAADREAASLRQSSNGPMSPRGALASSQTSTHRDEVAPALNTPLSEADADGLLELEPGLASLIFRAGTVLDPKWFQVCLHSSMLLGWHFFVLV